MQFDIRRFDIYRKIPKDLTQPTFAGACISVCSILFITYLFIAELTDFITPDVISELFVDDPVSSKERIPVKIDVSLPKCECKFIGLDIQDDMGRHEVGFVENVERIPIANNAGCRFKANFQINKVPGNFHVSTHASREQPDEPSMTHIIHEIQFGDVVPDNVKLPGSFNPLHNRDKTDANDQSTHDYFMKVVPTVYEDISGTTYYPYQYTFAHRDYIQYGHGHRTVPAIWFRYDLTPITVKYHEKRAPLYSFLTADYVNTRSRTPAIWFRYTMSPITVKYHERREPIYTFLTAVCAIVGGTFTVAGIFDSMFFTASEIFKKAELGKLS